MSLPAVLNEPSLPLYEAMSGAIAACFSTDECLAIATRAHAMAAYCRQVRDTENERKLNEIKLRAWRRLAELMAEIDITDCNTQRAIAARVRENMTADSGALLSDGKIIELLRLAKIPVDKFEENVADARGSIRAVVLRSEAPTPEERAARDAAASLAAQHREAEETAMHQERQREHDRKSETETAAILTEARQKGFAEVPAGLTMHPKFAREQKWFKFAMPTAVYEQLRDAAHVNHMTMWAVLRQALDIWFLAHGYKPISELVTPEAKTSRGPHRPGGFGGHM